MAIIQNDDQHADGPMVVVALHAQFVVRERHYATALNAWRTAAEFLRSTEASFELGPRITDVVSWQASNANGAPTFGPFGGTAKPEPGAPLATAVRRLFNFARPDAGSRSRGNDEASLAEMVEVGLAELRTAYRQLNAVASAIEQAAPWAKDIAQRHRGKPDAIVGLVQEVLARLAPPPADPQGDLFAAGVLELVDVTEGPAPTHEPQE